MNATPVIEINNLVRRYGRHEAVNGLSLRVLPGRCYGFFGRNAPGKPRPSNACSISSGPPVAACGCSDWTRSARKWR